LHPATPRRHDDTGDRRDIFGRHGLGNLRSEAGETAHFNTVEMAFSAANGSSPAVLR
jgi:hypothetical protein